MQNKKKFNKHFTVIAGLALTAASANAAAVFTEVTSGPNNPSTTTDELAYAGDVSSTDLLHGITGTTLGAFNDGAANLNNGVHGTNDADVGAFSNALGESAWTADSGTSREFVLGDGANAKGYDISEIQSIAAWNGAGFMNQKYEIYLRSLGGSYALYATVDYQPANDTDEGGATKVNVTDDIGLLGSGIDAIRFDFLDTVSNNVGGAAYRELDVFGIATVPEPSSTALLGLGGLALIGRRRRG